MSSQSTHDITDNRVNRHTDLALLFLKQWANILFLDARLHAQAMCKDPRQGIYSSAQFKEELGSTGSASHGMRVQAIPLKLTESLPPLSEPSAAPKQRRRPEMSSHLTLVPNSSSSCISCLEGISLFCTFNRSDLV